LFAIVTVLARRLTLEEFGVFGLLASLAGYLLVIQNAAAAAAVRNMAAAQDDDARTRSFSTAVLIYAAAGVAGGLFVAAVGAVLAGAVELPPGLEHDARVGALLLGAVTAVGWPLTIYRDALRASQLLVRAAAAELLALVAYAALVLGLAFGNASLTLLIAASGAIPPLVGLTAAAAATAQRVPFSFRRGAATRAEAWAFARLAGYVSATEAAATLVYAVHRVMLGLFGSAATVGLYEGPVRAHNVLRALNAATTVTVLPAASRLAGQSDGARLGALLTRGVRYTLALTVPLTVTGMVLAPAILEAWLGERFREGGTAMCILLSYWLVSGCTGVIAGLLVAGERARTLARLAWIVALANLALSLALTPWLGLEGVAIGTAIPAFAVFPYLMRAVLDFVPVDLHDLLRESFVPPLALGVVLAVGLVVLRVWAAPEGALPVAVAAGGGVMAYWLTFYAFCLRPSERVLVRDVAGSFLPGRR